MDNVMVNVWEGFHNECIMQLETIPCPYHTRISSMVKRLANLKHLFLSWLPKLSPFRYFLAVWLFRPVVPDSVQLWSIWLLILLCLRSGLCPRMSSVDLLRCRFVGLITRFWTGTLSAFFDWNVLEILPLSAFVFVDRLGLYWTRRRWRVKCKLMSFISLNIYLRRNVYLTLWRNNFQFEKKWAHYDIALLLSTYLQI